MVAETHLQTFYFVHEETSTVLGGLKPVKEKVRTHFENQNEIVKVVLWEGNLALKALCKETSKAYRKDTEATENQFIVAVW